MTWFDWFIVLSLNAAIIGYGLYLARGTETSSQWFLGARALPWWAVGLSYHVSLLSTISLVMVPGEIFNHGLSLYLIGPVSTLTSILMYSLFVRFYFRLNVFTPFTYLERRYDRHVRLLIRFC